MRRTKTGISPRLEVMEPRELLSGAAPLLSQHALSGVVRDVRAIMGTLARTNDTVQASARLTKLSARIPYGTQELGPSWHNDIGRYRPGSAWSVLATERQILGDLHRYLQGGGNAPKIGSGSTTITAPRPVTGGTGTPSPAPGLPGTGPGDTTTPVPASSLDSVRIQNTTGLALQVTIFLNTANTPQPFITEIIPAQGSTTALFNFGTATNAFMTMDVSRADGIPNPPPFDGVSLSQPMTGYNGALFAISLFSSYFNVTAL